MLQVDINYNNIFIFVSFAKNNSSTTGHKLKEITYFISLAAETQFIQRRTFLEGRKEFRENEEVSYNNRREVRQR